MKYIFFHKRSLNNVSIDFAYKNMKQSSLQKKSFYLRQLYINTNKNNKYNRNVISLNRITSISCLYQQFTSIEKDSKHNMLLKSTLISTHVKHLADCYISYLKEKEYKKLKDLKLNVKDQLINLQSNFLKDFIEIILQDSIESIIVTLDLLEDIVSSRKDIPLSLLLKINEIYQKHSCKHVDKLFNEVYNLSVLSISEYYHRHMLQLLNYQYIYTNQYYASKRIIDCSPLINFPISIINSLIIQFINSCYDAIIHMNLINIFHQYPNDKVNMKSFNLEKKELLLLSLLKKYHINFTKLLGATSLFIPINGSIGLSQQKHLLIPGILKQIQYHLKSTCNIKSMSIFEEQVMNDMIAKFKFPSNVFTSFPSICEFIQSDACLTMLYGKLNRPKFPLILHIKHQDVLNYVITRLSKSYPLYSTISSSTPDIIDKQSNDLLWKGCNPLTNQSFPNDFFSRLQALSIFHENKQNNILVSKFILKMTNPIIKREIIK